MALLLLGFCFGCLMFVAQLAMGLGSIDNHVHGLMLGVYLACFSHFILHKKVHRHVSDLMDGMLLDQYREYLRLFSSIFCVVQISYLILYLLSIYVSNNELYYEQIVLKCFQNGNGVNQEKYEFLNPDFISSGFLYFLPGVYFGLVYDAKFNKGTHLGVNETKIKTTVMRFLIMFIIICPVFLGLLTLSEKIRSVYVVFLLCSCLPAFLSGFLYMAFSNKLFLRLDLLNKEQTQVN